jgi:hypothetical protein
LFDGVLVDEMSGHEPHSSYSEVGTSLTSSAYIEGLAQQRDRSKPDVAQGFHHKHINDPDQAQLSSVSRETFQQCYQLHSCNSMVWQPGQQRDVVCLLRNGRARIGEATFIIDDERDSCQPALGSIPNAIFKSDSKGKIVVPVINHSKHGVALDQGDFIMHVLRMEPQQIYVVDANLDASREEEARKQFSAQENALLTLHQEWQAGDRPFFKREEGTDEKVVVATNEGMTETKTNYIADRRATSSAEHGNNEGSTAVMAITAIPRCMHKQRGVLPERHNASLADLLSGKYTICSISPDVFDRTDVIPVVVLFGGAGGFEKGLPGKKDGKHLVVAVSIEGDAITAQAHRLNNPKVPMHQLMMANHEEVLAAVERYLPRAFWSKSWWHASPSCKKGSCANYGQSPVEVKNWFKTANWTVALLKKSGCPVWTLENTVRLLQCFLGFPTARVFRMERHCALPQKRARLLVSNIVISIPLHEGPQLSCYDALAEVKGWSGPAANLLQRNSFAHVRTCAKPAFTVTSGPHHIGGTTIGGMTDQHIPTARDRSILQGWPLDDPMVFPPGNSETDNRVLVADLIPPPFATVLAIGDVFRTLVKANKIWHLRIQVSTVQHADSQLWTEEKLQQQVLLINEGVIKAAEVVKQMEETAPTRDVLSRDAPLSEFDCGKHGVWFYWGPELGYSPSWRTRQTLESFLMDEPWNVVLQPPLACQTKSEWHRQREAQRELRRAQLNETSDMASHDKEVRATPERPKRQHVFNIHPEPESVADYHSNRQLQADQPFLYGPYLSEGESYQTPRTVENVDKACAAAGLDELPERHKSERDFYRDLIYELWILFDDKMRSIKGVEIDLDLDHVKPIRLPPHRLSPAKTEIAKALVQDFVDEGLLKPVTSEWGFPIVIVLKPDGKAYRLCVDLRELNKIIPHDTYEPPTCDACLEWLAQRPFRSTGDCRWGFHQVLLSERMQKIMTLNTPFGTFCYQRLVMGYINATAEFQRHINNTLGDSLWREALAMVDDLLVASSSLAEHRVHMVSVLHKLARRHHSLKPSKMSILREKVKYLGHVCTEKGLEPSNEHKEAIAKMPYPAYVDKTINITSLRSFIGMIKYLRRYIKDCAKLCSVLNQLLCNDSDAIWKQEHQNAWDALVKAVVENVGIHHPNYHYPIYVCTDGSKMGVGGYLYQIIDGEERIVSFYSRSTTKAERKWDTRDLEVLAIIATLEHYRPVIDGQRLKVISDHKNLKWLMDQKNPSGRLGRWVLRLSEFDFELEYRKGARMQIADCLSRNSQRDSEWREDDEEMPAGIIKSEDLFVTKSSAEMLVVQLEKGLYELSLSTLLEEELGGEVLAAYGAGGQDDDDGSDDGYEEPAGRHDLPDSLRPQPITQKQMLQAQQKCDFCRGMIRDLEQEAGGSGKDRSSRYWAVFDGVLHRVTEASDAREGYDSARPFVPETLRPTVLHNMHNSVWGGHKGVEGTYKDTADKYFWHKMEVDIRQYVSECVACQLAKGTQPSRQGYLAGNTFHSSMSMVCMDLMGPLMSVNKGRRGAQQPVHIFVIVDPFSHRVWLETIPDKRAETIYAVFLRRILLEWGPPRAVLTDNGSEFDNVLLRELCKLWRVKLCYTPPLHPQSNYTERVNRYIGETLRNLVNAPGARRHDWSDYVKYIEFVYNRKYIPGTNLSPYMVTMGRQPLTPVDTAYMDSEGLAIATAPHASLEEHSKQLVAKLKMADEAVDVARTKALGKSREQFNQSRIEEKLLPGEMVRYFRRLTARRGVADADGNEVKLGEISKLKLRNEPYRVTRQLTPTTYQLEHPETGKPKPRPAHISQIARLKVPQQPRIAVGEEEQQPPDDVSPVGEQDTWEKLRSPGHTIFRFQDDEVYWLRVAEVLAVDLENGTAELWYYLRSRQHSTKKWHEPLVLSPHHPEYYDERSPGTSHLKPKKDKIPHLRRRQGQVDKTDVEIVVPYFLLETAGKVPRKVCAAADEYLRRQYKAGADVAPVALSFPTEGEEQLQKQLAASLRRPGGGK